MKISLAVALLCLVVSCRHQKYESDNWYFDDESAAYVKSGTTDTDASKIMLRLSGIKHGMPFYKGYAYVINTEGKLGVIDEKGNWKTTPLFENTNRYCDGIFDTRYDSTMIAVQVGGKWGYANHKGEIVIEPIYDIAYGFAHESPHSLVGIVNTSGQMCIGVIDRKGDYVIVPQPLHYGIEVYSKPVKADSGLQPKQLGDKWGFATADGTIKIAATHDEVGPFVCGFAPVRTGDNWTYINSDGKLSYSRHEVCKAFPFDQSGKAAVMMPEGNKYYRETIVGEDEWGEVIVQVDTINELFVECGFINRACTKANVHEENFMGFYLPNSYVAFLIAYDDGVILFVPNEKEATMCGAWSAHGEKETFGVGGQPTLMDIDY